MSPDGAHANATWPLLLRSALLLLAIVLLVLQAVAVVDLLSYDPPPGFVPDDEDQYVRYGLTGLPALGLYVGGAWLAIGGLRDLTRPARWTAALLAAGVVASLGWLWSMIGLVSG